MTASQKTGHRVVDWCKTRGPVLSVVSDPTIWLQMLQRAGRPVLAVGAALDDEQRGLGLREDAVAQNYHRTGGVENMGSLLRYLLKTRFGAAIAVAPVQPMPEVGLYDVASNRTCAGFEQNRAGYAHHKPGAPWIGVMFYRSSLVAGQTLPLAALAALAALVAQLEQAGYNVAAWPRPTPSAWPGCASSACRAGPTAPISKS